MSNPLLDSHLAVKRALETFSILYPFLNDSGIIATIPAASIPLASGEMLLGNASNVAAPVTPSGDWTIDNAGVAAIANDAVTNAKLANVATATIKGRVTAATGDPEDLTAAQVAAILAGQALIYEATEAVILAATKDAGALAYATDTLYLYKSIGAGLWMRSLFPMDAELAAPDRGAYEVAYGLGAQSNRWGYEKDAITDKHLSNIDIGGSVLTVNGGLRVSSSVLQAYLNGQWNDIVTNLRFRENSAGQYNLEQKPIGFDQWIAVISGNTTDLISINGLPFVQNYKASMGAYPRRLIIGGDTF